MQSRLNRSKLLNPIFKNLIIRPILQKHLHFLFWSDLNVTLVINIEQHADLSHFSIESVLFNLEDPVVRS